MSGNGLFDMLHDSAQSLLTSGGSLLSDLQQQLLPQQSSRHETFSSNRYLRRLADAREELLAHLRWSTPLLQPNTHVPLPTQWDGGTLFALVDCLHAIHNSLLLTHTAASDDPFGSSSSSSYLSIPPVTAALVSVLLLVFSRPGGVALREVALSPYCVIDRKEYWRLLSTHLVHLDVAHLLTNIASLLPDCSALEAAQGPAAFTADLLLLALTASTAYVAAALLHKSVLGQPSHYYSMVTVGASSLGFALKVWSGCRCRGSPSSLLGLLPVPPQFSWVPSLALTHLLVPQASFTAHMAGVAAGLLRAYCIEPVLQFGRHLWRCAASGGRSRRRGRLLGGGEGLDIQQQQQRQQGSDSWRHDYHRRFLDSRGDAADGLESSQATTSSSSRSRGQGRSSSSWCCWLRPGGELLVQLSCVGVAVGVYVMCSSSSSSSSRASHGHSHGFWRH